MNPTNTEHDYSIKVFSKTLSKDIKRALKSVKSYGSVELFIQDGIVTQITVRNIQKTNNGNGNGHIY